MQFNSPVDVDTATAPKRLAGSHQAAAGHAPAAAGRLPAFN
ncbi:hypothetical protein BGLT_01097 [Caballeronia glathei]|jgi:hypothetical protein|nr:hypothetical protein BGLT_01097 [Caballeronia glathei]